MDGYNHENTKRKISEDTSTNKRNKETNSTETNSTQDKTKDKVLHEETDKFDPFAYLNAIRMSQPEEPKRTTHTCKTHEKPSSANMPDQDNISSELPLDEIAFSEETEQNTNEESQRENREIETHSEIPRIPSMEIHSIEEPASYICTQTPIVSIEAKLQIAREQNQNRYVAIKEIKRSTSLKVEGVVLGYIIRHSPGNRAGSISITDGIDVIECSVSSDVLNKCKLEKDSIVLISTPSVWRLPYVENICVLNVVADNILPLAKETV